MIRRKIHKDPLFCLQGQLNSRNHIAISRNDNRHIAFVLICIGDHLSSDTNIRFLLFKSTNLVATISACDFLFQILSQDQLEAWIFLICLKESILIPFLINVIGTSRKVFHCNQFLIGFHKQFKELHYIKPIVLLPPGIRTQPIVEVESINIYNHSLFFHIAKK